MKKCDVSPVLVNIGFGNVVAVAKVVAIVTPGSAPMKRLREEAKKAGRHREPLQKPFRFEAKPAIATKEKSVPWRPDVIPCQPAIVPLSWVYNESVGVND